MEKNKLITYSVIIFLLAAFVYAEIFIVCTGTNSNKKQLAGIEQSIFDSNKRIETNLSGIREQIDALNSTYNELQIAVDKLREYSTDLVTSFEDIQKIYNEIGTGVRTTTEKLRALENLNRKIGKEIEKLWSHNNYSIKH